MVTILKQFAEMPRIDDTRESLPAVDGALVITIPKTDEPDLTRMMDAYGNALLRLCFLYLKDMALAEDAVQETFLKVYRNWHRFDGGTGEKAWINRIAINVCKDMLRSAWRRRVNVVEELADIPDGADAYTAADTTLVEAVLGLKPKYKEVILLFYYEDMKISDIAAVLGAPESTISVRLKRARDLLKKQLGGWYYGSEE